jgi:Lar family restriction alleviation protein
MTANALNKALKPCPFCGGSPERVSRDGDERNCYARTVKYRCTSCNASSGEACGDASKGGYADNRTVERRAVEAWNRRTERGAV